jgi:uncharacterized cupin superfamily protein
MQFGNNVFDVEWDPEDGSGVRGRRLLERPPLARLRSAVWELDPGATAGPYHLHHGAEELVIVLRGRPTLRTPGGERELEEGAAAYFEPGPNGAHQLLNRSDQPVRYVMVASHVTPDVVEYLDEGKIISWPRPSRRSRDIRCSSSTSSATRSSRSSPRPRRASGSRS